MEFLRSFLFLSLINSRIYDDFLSRRENKCKSSIGKPAAIESFEMFKMKFRSFKGEIMVFIILERFKAQTDFFIAILIQFSSLKFPLLRRKTSNCWVFTRYRPGGERKPNEGWTNKQQFNWCPEGRKLVFGRETGQLRWGFLQDKLIPVQQVEQNRIHLPSFSSLKWAKNCFCFQSIRTFNPRCWCWWLRF